ncbi:MAG TPA: mandelate racemase/muconate lactonizing enzyme family protein [Bryobacteraceae bacterium]|nr:mandelate racemase/muconate lactonizing enzyme family protein [Bryobacteraceae bacterium]
MQLTRRQITTGAIGAAVRPASAARQRYAAKPHSGPSMDDLARAAAKPVLKRDGLKTPVIIESIDLLRAGKEYFARVRSTDGAEGISVCNPPRADYFDRVFKNLLVPALLKKDARDLDNLLWEVYRHGDNYKLYGIALWSPLAWAEMAILDMLGRIAGKSIGQLLGDVRRKEIAVYVASGRRDSTPPQEIEYLQSLVEKSRAKALKFRLGGRMSRNADAMPGRTETLIPLVRKTFGDEFDLHGDANSSYDPAHAIPVGKLLEENGYVYYEEPCEFDALEDTKKVRDSLSIPVALGEQEYSEWRFRWCIRNRVCDIVQPDLFYYGGMIRSLKVARMAELAKMPTTVHISGGFGFVYMLHFASIVPDIGKYQEYKLGMEKYGEWFDPPITVKNGMMSVPSGPGVGIKDPGALLKDAKVV